GRPKSQDRRAKAKDLHSMIRMPHIDNFRYRFRNEFTNLCCVRDVAASALGDVRGAISSFKHMLDSQLYIARFLFESRSVSQHQCSTSKSAKSTRDALTGDVCCAAVHRFIQSDTPTDRCRSKHAERSSNHSRFIGENIAK